MHRTHKSGPIGFILASGHQLPAEILNAAPTPASPAAGESAMKEKKGKEKKAETPDADAKKKINDKTSIVKVVAPDITGQARRIMELTTEQMLVLSRLAVGMRKRVLARGVGHGGIAVADIQLILNKADLEVIRKDFHGASAAFKLINGLLGLWLVKRASTSMAFVLEQDLPGTAPPIDRSYAEKVSRMIENAFNSASSAERMVVQPPTTSSIAELEQLVVNLLNDETLTGPSKALQTVRIKTLIPKFNWQNKKPPVLLKECPRLLVVGNNVTLPLPAETTNEELFDAVALNLVLRFRSSRADFLDAAVIIDLLPAAYHLLKKRLGASNDWIRNLEGRMGLGLSHKGDKAKTPIFVLQ